MIVLKEIKMSQNRIEADYYPENENVCGHISIGLPKGDTIELIPARGYEHTTCASHAKMELLRLAKLERIPREKTVVWY